jgi:hypothetical protein
VHVRVRPLDNGKDGDVPCLEGVGVDEQISGLFGCLRCVNKTRFGWAAQFVGKGRDTCACLAGWLNEEVSL